MKIWYLHYRTKEELFVEGDVMYGADTDRWANVSAGGYAAYSLAYDLGKLSHLEKYGVDLSRI